MQDDLSILILLEQVHRKVIELIDVFPERRKDSVSQEIRSFLIRTAQTNSKKRVDESSERRDQKPQKQFPGVESCNETVLCDDEPTENEMERE